MDKIIAHLCSKPGCLNDPFAFLMSLEEHGKEKYLVCRIINRTQNILQISDLTSMEMKTNYSTQFYQRLFLPSSQILPLLYLF